MDAVAINGYTSEIRLQFAVTVADTSVKVPDTVETENGFFELKAATTETQNAVSKEIDEGFLECISIDISGFDGVKGVEFTL